MRIIEDLTCAEDVTRGRLPHLQRVVEVLDTDATEHRVVVRRHVPRRVDPGEARLQRGIDLESVVGRDR